MIKVYITKYALTSGIEIVKVNIYSNTPSLVRYNTGGFDQYAHVEGREWHRTAEAAIKRAEEMRVAKIKSLHKSIARIEKLKFDIEE